MKKILGIILSLFFFVGLVGCTNQTTDKKTSSATKEVTTKTSSTVVTQSETKEDDETYILPDLSGKSTSEVKAYFEEHTDITNYSITVKKDLVYGDGEGEYEYEKFYGFAGSNSVAGAEFKYSKKLTVYVTAYNLPNSLDEFMLEHPELEEAYKTVTLEGKTYLDKSFIETGCGEVEVVSYVDGDTTRFKDKNGTTISLRYLGIDTPESTAAFEPWGKAASAFTEDSLSHAKKVVLEAEAPGQTDSNGRYLGWVWFQKQDDSWHLLNLELILFCYTNDKADSDSIYGDLATSIGTIIGKTGRRVWGEHDPNYDYSTDPKEVTIEELRTNFAAYYSKKVKITGVIALVDECSAVIVDPVTKYGVYFYVPSWNKSIAYNIVAGNEVTIIGVATYYGGTDDADLDNMDESLGDGSPQLTDFKEKNITVISERNKVEPVEMMISDIEVKKIGMYVTFKNLTVTKISVASTGSGYTVYCKDAQNNKIGIRVDNSHFHNIEGDGGINSDSFSVGQVISSVTGYLSYYYDYQVVVTGEASFVFSD